MRIFTEFTKMFETLLIFCSHLFQLKSTRETQAQLTGWPEQVQTLPKKSIWMTYVLNERRSTWADQTLLPVLCHRLMPCPSDTGAIEVTNNNSVNPVVWGKILFITYLFPVSTKGPAHWTCQTADNTLWKGWTPDRRESFSGSPGKS